MNRIEQVKEKLDKERVFCVAYTPEGAEKERTRLAKEIISKLDSLPAPSEEAVKRQIADKVRDYNYPQNTADEIADQILALDLLRPMTAGMVRRQDIANDLEDILAGSGIAIRDKIEAYVNKLASAR